MAVHLTSNRHDTRRILLAVGVVGLTTLGLLHDQNAWALPWAGLAAFWAMFALVTVGGVTLLSSGVQAFRPLFHFVRNSSALLIFVGIAHFALFGLGLVSWPNMALYERVLFSGFFAVGAYGAFREYLFGILPDSYQRERDLHHH